MKKLIFLIGLILMVSMAFSTITLSYMYWGSPLEKKAQEDMLKAFEKAHPGIKVKAIYVPSNYDEKISAMLAGGNPPHVAQLGEGLAFEWAEKGEVMDILPLIKQDPDPSVQIENRLPMTWYWYDGGKKTFGTNLAVEVMLLWYNKELFDKAGVPYPPANPEEWTWKKFLDTAIKLTVDRSGKHPNEPGFDPKHIKTYGVVFGRWWGHFLPFIWSNGGDICDEEGKIPLINRPEAVEALQALGDLVNKYHVAPTPAQLEAFPAFHIALQTKRVAMAINGQWALLDLGDLAKKGKLKLGVAPLPRFKKPVCLELGAPNVIFTKAVKDDPEVLKAAWELYKWSTDSEKVLPLIRNGLWMPLQVWWYKDPSYLKKWLDPKVHPPEYKEAVIDYLLNYGKRAPSYYLRNWNKIADIMYQEVGNILYGKVTAEEACESMAKKIAPYLQGRYDK